MCSSILPSPSRTVNVESGAVSVPVNDSATQLAEAVILLASQDLTSAVVAPSRSHHLLRSSVTYLCLKSQKVGKLLINTSGASCVECFHPYREVLYPYRWSLFLGYVYTKMHPHPVKQAYPFSSFAVHLSGSYTVSVPSKYPHPIFHSPFLFTSERNFRDHACVRVRTTPRTYPPSSYPKPSRATRSRATRSRATRSEL